MPWASSPVLSESLQGVQKIPTVSGSSMLDMAVCAPLVERYLEIAFAVFCFVLFCFILDTQRVTIIWVILFAVE